MLALPHSCSHFAFCRHRQGRPRQGLAAVPAANCCGALTPFAVLFPSLWNGVCFPPALTPQCPAAELKLQL